MTKVPFEKTQRGIDLPKHQSYILIHLALCDNTTEPHEHPAAERYFAEAMDDATAKGVEMAQDPICLNADCNEVASYCSMHSVPETHINEICEALEGAIRRLAPYRVP